MLNTTKISIRAIAVFMLAFSLAGLYSCQGDNSGGSATSESGVVANEDKPLGHLLEKYLKPYPDELTALTDPAKGAEILQAMEAYNAGRYEEAIGLFPNYSQTIEQAGYIHLYKGISELMIGKEYDAFRTFQLIRASMGKAFQASNWYLALNYVSFNNVFEARRKLDEIVTNQSYPADMAQQLLNDLPEN